MSACNTNEPARVLIVDDHPLVRAAVAQMIGSRPDMHVCGEAGGLDEAMRQIRRTRPDLMIVDLFLSDGNGIDLIEDVGRRWPGTRMLAISAQDEFLFAERALRAGAWGYVSKSEPSANILRAVRQVLQGSHYISPGMVNRLLSRAAAFPRLDGKPPVEGLSHRERQVFGLLGCGFTTREIAETLGLSPKTVESYREGIKLKLDLRNRTELLQHAIHWTLERGCPAPDDTAVTAECE